jgi:hypothetical protein
MMRGMSRRLQIASIAVCAFLSGCASPSATFREAEALEGEGKHEEAAAKFDLVCALEPKTEQCPSAGARASEARIHAAEKAAKDGAWQKAEKLYRAALLSAEGAPAATAKERLSSDELKQGVRYEKAAADPDKPTAFVTMEALAAGQGPVAEKAKAWMATERPGILVVKVKEACRPKPKGSCSELWKELEALPQKPAGYDEARAARDTETGRITQSLLVATRFLDVFKGRHTKDAEYTKCIEERTGPEAGMSPETARPQCSSEIYDKVAHERYAELHQEDETFRKALATIADPALVSALESRRSDALATGKYEKLETKKASGGGK